MPVKSIILPVADEAALADYAEKLDAAYDNGKARGGSIDHSDLQEALDAAVLAFGPAGEEFKAAVEALEFDTGEEIDFEEVEVTFDGREPSGPESSAAKLLVAFATPDDFAWEKADDAHETLQASKSSPRP